MQNQGIARLTFTVSSTADFGASLQYCAAKLDGDETVTPALVAGEKNIGPVQNKPLKGEAAELPAPGSIATYKLGDTVAAGDFLMVEVTTSRFVTATTGNYYSGIATRAGADGDECPGIVQYGQLD